MRTLNVGCGTQTWGTNRIDLVRTSGATEVGDVCHLPYRSGCFDEALADFVLEHQPNPLAMLREVRRVLRPGGVLRLSTDNFACMCWYFRGLRWGDHHGSYRNPLADRDRHFMIFGDGHLRNLMREAGFEVRSLDLYTRWDERSLTRSHKYVSRVLRFVSPRFGHAHWRIVAERGALPPWAAPDVVAKGVRS